MSISSDGRVSEWSINKGLACKDLMLLRRSKGESGAIARQSAGLTFDFPLGDRNTYFAGTEDGSIHKCSCSYTEQSLDVLAGHAGPVLKVTSSPFGAGLLSCSADWTVKLWDSTGGTGGSSKCAGTFRSGDLTTTVLDVAWCPLSGSVFALAAADGRVEIWDLEKSTLDPSLTFHGEPATGGSDDDLMGLDDYDGPPLIGQTSLLFADHKPLLLVGDQAGRVRVYKLSGLNLDHGDSGGDVDFEVQAAKLDAALGR